MYQGDSFFTLTAAGQVGLACLSLILAVTMLGLCHRMTRAHRLLPRALIGGGLIWAFEWLSPQIYYLYYILILDVPWQIVIGSPPGLGHLIDLMAFQAREDLSHHGRAVLAWALLLVALWPPRTGAAMQG